MKVVENNHISGEELEKLKKLRPIDGEFMCCLFEDSIPLAQLVFGIITNNPDIVITKCETQKEMKFEGKVLPYCFAIYAVDSTGKKYNLEVEKNEYWSSAKTCSLSF